MDAEGQKKLEESVPKESNWVYRGHCLDLRVDTFDLQGRKKITELVHRPAAAVIIAMDDQKRVLLIRQWRRAIGKILLELPAGTLEDNELPMDCARRELQEETGFLASSIELIGSFYVTPGYSDEFLHLFFAKDLEKKPIPRDDDEGIDLTPVSIEQALKYIENGMIIDTKSIIGIYQCAKRFL